MNVQQAKRLETAVANSEQHVRVDGSEKDLELRDGQTEFDHDLEIITVRVPGYPPLTMPYASVLWWYEGDGLWHED